MGTGRKQYGAALERLHAALVAPTMVVNAITLSSYKKWLLLCLIRHGKVGGACAGKRDVGMKGAVELCSPLATDVLMSY